MCFFEEYFEIGRTLWRNDRIMCTDEITERRSAFVNTMEIGDSFGRHIPKCDEYAKNERNREFGQMKWCIFIGSLKTFDIGVMWSRGSTESTPKQRIVPTTRYSQHNSWNSLNTKRARTHLVIIKRMKWFCCDQITHFGCKLFICIIFWNAFFLRWMPIGQCYIEKGSAFNQRYKIEDENSRIINLLRTMSQPYFPLFINLVINIVWKSIA